MRLMKKVGRYWATALVALAAHGAARGEAFLDWFGTIGQNGLPFIATVNDSNSYLGQWCEGDVQKCFWLLVTKLPCKTGTSAPALVNSSAGVTVITATCAGVLQISGETYYRNALSTFDAVESVLKKNERISFALAIEDDSFRVFRFSAKGVPAALFWMAAEKTKQADKKQKTTSDVTL